MIKKTIKHLGNILAILSLMMLININSVSAQTRLTPYHIYSWAKDANLVRLDEFRYYINIYDKTTKQTALCIAESKQDEQAFQLLLRYGASTHVSCLSPQRTSRTFIKETGGLNTGAVILGTVLAGAGTIAALA